MATKSKDLPEVEYDSIFVIVERNTKMIHYDSLLTNLNIEQLVKVIIVTVVNYYSLLHSIDTD